MGMCTGLEERMDKEGNGAWYIYGAKSLALGAFLAVRTLFPGQKICGFIVKSLDDNPATLAGLPVRQLADVSEKKIHILIATPEDLHREIISDLETYGFSPTATAQSFNSSR